MPTPFAISSRLNENYKAALRKRLHPNDYPPEIFTYTGSCCGISELVLEDSICPDDFDTRNLTTIVAHGLDKMFTRIGDDRVYFVGLPVGKSTGDATQYDFKMYQKYLRIFRKFGAKQVHLAPYINNNSKNYLHVLAFQKPL